MDLIPQVSISVPLLCQNATAYSLSTWNSGYDFGYLVKLLTCITLPTSEEDFFEVLSTWFPTVYDVKFMMRACKALKGGLQEVADDLGVSQLT